MKYLPWNPWKSFCQVAGLGVRLTCGWVESGSYEDLQPADAVWEGLDYVSIESIGLGHPQMIAEEKNETPYFREI